MIRLFVATILSMLTTSAGHSQSINVSAIPVYILVEAGQSNGRAAGTLNSSPIGDLSVPLNDIFIWDRDGHTFVQYAAGVNSDPGNASGAWGTEAAFSLLWKQDNPGVPLYIVKYTIGNTWLYPTAGGLDWNVTSPGELFDTLVGDVVAAKASLIANNKNPVVIAFDWNQGENDAGGAGPWPGAVAYSTNLTMLCNAVKSFIANSNVIIIIERIRPTPDMTEPISQVRAAQVEAATSDLTGRTRVIDLDIDDYTNLHPSPLWVQHKGERAYAAYKGTYVADYGAVQ